MKGETHTIPFSKLTALGILLAAGVLALAQGSPQPAPVPAAPRVAPVAPVPVQMAAPVAAPLPPEPPEPPEPPMPMIAPEPFAFGDMDIINIEPDITIEPFEFEFGPERQLAINGQIDRAMEKTHEAQEKIAGMNLDFNFDFKKDRDTPYRELAQAYSQDSKMYGRRGGSDDDLYNRGKGALDAHHWDQALDRFSELAARGGAGADGALYWKAYSLDRLARRDEALATIAELRKTFPNSRWLEDARALEVEVNQAAGKPAAPEAENDDDIKLLALNGLMQSDPDRAFPILENLLKGAQAPRLKQRTLFVLAENGSPRAQQLLERIARGNANPDLQLEAITYMSVVHRKQSNNGQMLFEIYNSSTDAAVKRAVVRGMVAAQDKDHLLQIARSEKNPELRMQLVHMLPAFAAQPEIWQLYQAETVPDVKKQILHAMAAGANSEKLLEVARTDKDASVRCAAIQDLSAIRAPSASEGLVAIYSADQDKDVKRAIVSTLFAQKNAKALVDLGRKENDAELKRHIVRLLVEMKSADATAFLEEILK